MASGSLEPTAFDTDRVIGRDPVTIEGILSFARGERRAVLDGDPAYRARLGAARRTVEQNLRAGAAIYGVTTGVGASVGNQIPPALLAELPHNLLRFHGCGPGRLLDEETRPRWSPCGWPRWRAASPASARACSSGWRRCSTTTCCR